MRRGWAWHLELKKRQFETMRLEWKRHLWPLQTSRWEGTKEQMQRWSVMFCVYLVRKTPQSLVYARVTFFLHGSVEILPPCLKRKGDSNKQQSKLTDTIFFSHLFFAQEHREPCFRQAFKLFGHLREEQESKTSWVLTSNQQRIHVEIAARYWDIQPYAYSIISCRSRSWRCRSQNSSQTLE
jgi:hypothetical protein